MKELFNPAKQKRYDELKAVGWEYYDECKDKNKDETNDILIDFTQNDLLLIDHFKSEGQTRGDYIRELISAQREYLDGKQLTEWAAYSHLNQPGVY
jgi:hypothetical protein